MLKRLLFPLVGSAVAAGLCVSAQAAPENVASLTYSTTIGSQTTNDGLTYENTIEAVTDFSGVSGTGYTVISSAPNTFVQRNGTPNQSSVWYTINSSTGNLAGVNQTNYGTLLKSNNLLEGADNVFAGGTGASSGNIERLDYTWNTPFTNFSRLAFAVFERGAVGSHDAFTIAIVTAVDGSGTPTAYGAYVKVAAGWGGSANLTGNPTNQLLRYNNGDNISASTNQATLGTDQNTQGIGGIVLKVADFGLAAGTTVYGYSLMDFDVNPTTPSDLLNVANTAVYPANSNNPGGEIDLVAVNGSAFQFVPEPSTWALLSMGGAALGGALLRRRGRNGRGSGGGRGV